MEICVIISKIYSAGNIEISLAYLEQMCYNIENNGKRVSRMRNLPVDVISVCNADGSFKPLRLRMEDEEHQLLKIHIDEVISMKPIQYVGIEAQIFLCRATVNGRQWLFELKYTIRTHCWCFYRRIA